MTAHRARRLSARVHEFQLDLTESPDGVRVTTHNPEFEQQMRAARAIMKKRRAVLKELAK